MNHVQLGAALRAAVLAQDFDSTPDALQGGAPIAAFPSIDLALVAFPAGRAPVWANVLFSREQPQGVVADVPSDAAALRGIRFDADLTDEHLASIAWAPDADWQRLPWRHLWGDVHGAGARFVAPYPASLLKLMVAVGVGLALDRGLIDTWPDALAPTIVVSDNDATTELVALLHRHAMIAPLNGAFSALGLPTLQLNGTQPDGGWRNADGSGVGHIHMTAWDTVRLLWLLDAAAPAAPWLPPGTPLLRPATRDHLRGVLQAQQLDHILSSGAVRGVPGWVPGLPDAPAFAHKTGNTQNYSADAGIVRTPRCHYIVALLSNLGQRFAPDARCATTWRLPALGAAIHQLMEALS